LIQFAQGKSISRLVWDRITEGDLLPAWQLAGKIIVHSDCIHEQDPPITIETYHQMHRRSRPFMMTDDTSNC
jgi:hypothetical protein